MIFLYFLLLYMSNFNLLAPQGKCADFNVSFKEPIEIKADSKIQFNWAKFGRSKKILFKEDIIILVRPSTPIPSRIPNSPATLNLNQATYETVNRIVISAGSYTANQLQEEIRTKLDLFIGSSTLGTDPTNGWNTQGLLEATIRSLQDVFGDDIVIGMKYLSPVSNSEGISNYEGSLTSFASVNGDATNGLNYYFMFDHVNGTLQQAFSKIGDLGGRTPNSYDNYFLSTEHLNHYGVQQLSNIGKVLRDNVNGDIFSENWDWTSGFTASATKSIEDIGQRTLSGGTNENIMIGLYSREYATGTGIVVDATRTNGTNNTNPDGNPVPCLTTANSVEGRVKAFVQVEIGQNYGDSSNFPDADYIMVHCANKGTSNTVDTLGSMRIDTPIAGLTTCYCVKLSEMELSPDYVPQVILYTYYKQNENYDKKIDPTGLDETSSGLLDEDKLFFCVGLLITNEMTGQDEMRMLFDSGKKGFEDSFFFQKSFFNYYEDTLGAAQTALQVNTQIPFNLIMSAQFAGDGWCDIGMKCIKKTQYQIGYDYDDYPSTIVRGIQFIIPEILGKMIDPTNRGVLKSNWQYPLPQTHILYTPDTNNEVWGEHLYISDAKSAFIDDDIAIYIEDFTLNNYKNTQISQTKGAKKNLLGVCPAPFSNFSQVGNKLIAWYSPYNPFITSLRNQTIKINNMRITIKDSETDRPLEDLDTATIDFTIME